MTVNKIIAIVVSLIVSISLPHIQPTHPQFGAFTQISTNTQINGFPTTYNDNLNKTIEVGTTSVASITALSNLATVGTIGSGVWNGTVITSTFGGTGSSSPSKFNVLLGSSTNAIGIVKGLGTSGQFLTSQGDGVAPTWTTGALDASLNFTWTGKNTYQGTGTTTLDTPLRIQASGSSLFDINGQGYAFPTTTAAGQSPYASSTVLAFDGNKQLYWYDPNVMLTNWATSTYQQAGVTGNQVIAHNLGRVPKIIEIHARSQTDGSTTHALSSSEGVATSTDTTSQNVSTLAMHLTSGGEGCTTVKTGSVILLIDSNSCPNVDAEATISVITANSITINWSTNTGSGNSRNRQFTMILR